MPTYGTGSLEFRFILDGISSIMVVVVLAKKRQGREARCIVHVLEVLNTSKESDGCISPRSHL